MNTDSLYLIGNLNSSNKEFYQTNTVDNFRIKLNKPLLFTEGKWKVGLCEIHIVNVKLNVDKYICSSSSSIVKRSIDNNNKKIDVTEEVDDVVSSSVSNTSVHSIETSPSGNIEYVNEADNNDDNDVDTHDKVDNVLCNGKERIKNNVYLHVEFETCEGLFVDGESSSHVIRVIPYEQDMREIFTAPFYVPVQTSYIDTCHIRIRALTTASVPIAIHHSNNACITCTLHFKKSV